MSATLRSPAHARPAAHTHTHRPQPTHAGRGPHEAAPQLADSLTAQLSTLHHHFATHDVTITFTTRATRKVVPNTRTYTPHTLIATRATRSDTARMTTRTRTSCSTAQPPIPPRSAIEPHAANLPAATKTASQNLTAETARAQKPPSKIPHRNRP